MRPGTTNRTKQKRKKTETCVKFCFLHYFCLSMAAYEVSFVAFEWPGDLCDCKYRNMIHNNLPSFGVLLLKE